MVKLVNSCLDRNSVFQEQEINVEGQMQKWRNWEKHKKREYYYVTEAMEMPST